MRAGVHAQEGRLALGRAQQQGEGVMFEGLQVSKGPAMRGQTDTEVGPSARCISGA